jgi:hypothetical protein
VAVALEALSLALRMSFGQEEEVVGVVGKEDTSRHMVEVANGLVCLRKTADNHRSAAVAPKVKTRSAPDKSRPISSDHPTCH